MTHYRGTTNEEGSCRTCRSHLHRFVEGELEPVRSAAVRAHLARCSSCRKHRGDLHHERLGLLEALVNRPPLSDRLTKKIIRRLQREQTARREKRRTRVAAGGVAAALAVALVLGQLMEPRSGEEGRREAPVAGAPAPAPEGTMMARASSGARAGEVSPSGRDSDRVLREESSRPQLEPAVWRSLNFSDVVGMAVQLTPPALPSSRPREEDPCRPDPNKDGRIDLLDIAHSCQILMGGQSVVDGSSPHFHSLAQPDDAAAAPDCEEYCLRV